MLLTGCAASAPPTPVPSAAALVGHWNGDYGGSLALEADMDGTARLLPVGTDVVSGRCRWSVGPRAADGAPTVVLDFSGDASAHFATATFEVVSAGRRTTLRHDDGSGQHTDTILAR